MIYQVVRDVGGMVIEVEVMADRVHLLAEVPPTVALPTLVQWLKGRSWRVLCQEFARLGRLPSSWTGSWFVSAVGGASLGVVGRYVENQKQAA